MEHINTKLHIEIDVCNFRRDENFKRFLYMFKLLLHFPLTIFFTLSSLFSISSLSICLVFKLPSNSLHSQKKKILQPGQLLYMRNLIIIIIIIMSIITWGFSIINIKRNLTFNVPPRPFFIVVFLRVSLNPAFFFCFLRFSICFFAEKKNNDGCVCVSALCLLSFGYAIHTHTHVSVYLAFLFFFGTRQRTKFCSRLSDCCAV